MHTTVGIHLKVMTKTFSWTPLNCGRISVLRERFVMNRCIHWTTVMPVWMIKSKRSPYLLDFRSSDSMAKSLRVSCSDATRDLLLMVWVGVQGFSRDSDPEYLVSRMLVVSVSKLETPQTNAVAYSDVFPGTKDLNLAHELYRLGAT